MPSYYARKLIEGADAIEGAMQSIKSSGGVAGSQADVMIVSLARDFRSLRDKADERLREADQPRRRELLEGIAAGELERQQRVVAQEERLQRRYREREPVAQNECTQHSSAVRDFCMGPSTGTGTDLPPVPVAHAGCVPCDAEARREASGPLSSFSRKS